MIGVLGNAAAGGTHPDPVAGFALGLAMLLLAARLGGRLFEKLGQPGVLGELVAGVALGNLYLTGLDQAEFVRGDVSLTMFGAFGAVLLLFQVGLESNIRTMLKVGATAFNVAVVGVVAPMVFGYVVSYMLVTGPWTTHLFVAATLSATSVGLTAAVLRDLQASQSSEGRIILGAAVIDDVLGLLVLAVVSGLIRKGQIEALSLIWIVVKALGFLGISLVLGHYCAPTIVRMTARLGHKGKVMALVVFACTLAWAAAMAGLAPIVGAFAAGLVLEEAHFEDHGHQRTAEELLEPIAEFVVPVFFVLMGFQVRLVTFADPSVLLMAGALTLAAIIGKQFCGLPFKRGTADRLTVGIGMIPRGEVGLIFAVIGKQLGVVSDGVYSAIVIMVIATTMVTPTALAWAVRRRR